MKECPQSQRSGKQKKPKSSTIFPPLLIYDNPGFSQSIGKFKMIDSFQNEKPINNNYEMKFPKDPSRFLEHHD